MTKFQKRVSKSHQPILNALVIGNGFGHLEEILDLFRSVFVSGPTSVDVKRKNFIFREDLNNLDGLTEIAAIFIDLNYVDKLEILVPIMNKFYPTIFIEGNEVIGRNLSGSLYKNHYRAVEQQGFFHVWKKK